LGAAEHFLREIHADAACWLQGGKQTPCSAADFKDARVGRDEETIDFGKAAVIPDACAGPMIAFLAMWSQWAMRLCW
jgi:hypothetical protein